MNMITGTVSEEDTEDDEDKLSAVKNNNMNKLDTITPPKSGTIQIDEAMDDTKSPIDDKVKNNTKPTKSKHKTRNRRSNVKSKLPQHPNTNLLGTINYDLIYV